MATQQPIHGPEELEPLELLRDVQRVLAHALESLEGQSLPPGVPRYLAWAAGSVDKAADGYLWLRESYRVYASKLLVRPALEATFAGTAVVKDPRFLFRKTYSEWKDDTKMFSKDAAAMTAAGHTLDDLKRAAKSILPGCPVECKLVTVRDVAETAGLLNVYENAYRTYCNFTHGAMRAVQGQLDDPTDPIDTKMVAWCVLMMLEHLRDHTGAKVPDLKPFMKKLEAIDTN